MFQVVEYKAQIQRMSSLSCRQKDDDSGDLCSLSIAMVRRGREGKGMGPREGKWEGNTKKKQGRGGFYSLFPRCPRVYMAIVAPHISAHTWPLLTPIHGRIAAPIYARTYTLLSRIIRGEGYPRSDRIECQIRYGTGKGRERKGRSRDY